LVKINTHEATKGYPGYPVYRSIFRGNGDEYINKFFSYLGFNKSFNMKLICITLDIEIPWTYGYNSSWYAKFFRLLFFSFNYIYIYIWMD